MLLFVRHKSWYCVVSLGRCSLFPTRVGLRTYQHPCTCPGPAMYVHRYVCMYVRVYSSYQMKSIDNIETEVCRSDRWSSKGLSRASKSYISEMYKPFKAYWSRGAPTVWHSTTVRSAHTVFMCFVFTSEQTATCFTYSINWLVFITEMKSVYSAVRTSSLNKAVWASSLKG